MDTDVITEVAKESGNISGTMIVLIVFCIGWLLERIYKITSQKKTGLPTWHEVNKKFKTKETCQPAMERVGGAIDKIEKVNDEQDKSIRGLEKGVSFIVGRMGGDYDRIKNGG